MAKSKTRTFFNAVHALMILGSGTFLYVVCCYVINTNAIIPYTPQVINTPEVARLEAYNDMLNVLPSYTVPISMDTKWVCDLHRVVKQLKGRQVTLLVSDRNYYNVLVNWLAHSILYAFQPLKSILIISFDTFTHVALRRKGFQSVYIPPQYIMKAKNFTSRFAHIWVTRLTVMRILNHWNYSVLVFDSDAIMLRNIQPLLDKFNDSDIISSSGSYPFDLHRKWAVPTLCMGVFLIKSSPATELLWYMMRSVHKSTDDQVRMNRALDAMGIQWKLLNNEGYHEGITGGPTSLRVTTIPTTIICRYCKQKLIGKYYVWHHHAVRKGAVKKERLSTTGFWLLEDYWNVTVWNSVTAEQWLLSITKSL